MTYADGSIYEGLWKDDKKYGQGVTKDAYGSIIDEGIWENDECISPVDVKTIEYEVDGFIGDLEKTDSKVFFSSFRNMATLFATGDLKMNILAMIAKFEKSEGGEYRNQAMTRAVRGHPTTIKFSDTLIKEVKAKLAEIDGDVNKLVLNDLMQQYNLS